MYNHLEIENIDQLAANTAALRESRFQTDLPQVFAELISTHAKESLKLHLLHTPRDAFGKEISDCMVIGFSINHQASNNHFLNNCNEAIINNGLILGWTDTYETRKAALKEKYPKQVFPIAYAWDAIWHRFLPKVPLLGAAHDWAFGDEKRLMSKVEMIGRLYAAGFELLEEKIIDGKQYFVAQKTSSAIRAESPTYAPLVKLKRIGIQGREFHIYKFRTMYPYSEYLQEMVFSQNNLQAGGKFKDDFRISKFGRFLRKIWLDELPMVWNLVRGDIKIVGVRPLSRHYFNLYTEELQAKRIQFRPGLLPPFYADLPKTLEEIMASEMKYLQAYEKSPIRTDIRYFFKILGNIVLKGARSA
jgi:lipopolysaccharide/colanic/teichoic acid biosynthesis glycosyltransferase